jgi:uncharacterized protein (TIGR02118 family)
MHITYVAFNFKGADVEAEERHYLDYHLALAKSLPGVSLYLAGRLRPIQGRKPERFRAAVLAYPSAEASMAAMSNDASMKLMADSQEHLTDLRLEILTAEEVVPFKPRRPGAACFVLGAAFDFQASQGDRAAAERKYRSVHVEIARKLPGLRGYLIAPLEGGERQRIAFLVFDSFDSFRAAMASPAGRELAKDGEATITNVRFDHIDARVEV